LNFTDVVSRMRLKSRCPVYPTPKLKALISVALSPEFGRVLNWYPGEEAHRHGGDPLKIHVCRHPGAQQSPAIVAEGVPEPAAQGRGQRQPLVGGLLVFDAQPDERHRAIVRPERVPLEIPECR
jgi:hypothetical protein